MEGERMELENMKREEYGEQYNEHLLEQWKSCVEMANCNSERRISTNNVYISISAAIIALISFSLDYKSILLSVVGTIVCVLWLNSIDSYKRLSSVKYQIINEIEKKLPISPYGHEWSLLSDNKKYKRFTHIERILPWIFIILFALCALWQIIICIYGWAK